MISPALSTHLADFETTIAGSYTMRDFLAALNFAALLHEHLYLSDIALGDHPLIISSYLNTTDQQLFRTLAELIGKGVILCLLRDKVVVRDKTLVDSSPSISDIYRGWRFRGQDAAFTTQNFSAAREGYNEYVDELLFRLSPNSVIRYDPDKVKNNYRDRIRKLAALESSPLTRLLTPLSDRVRRAYDRIWDNTDGFFTNADFYTLLRNEQDTEALIVAHGRVNQQCFADFVHTGQTQHEDPRASIERFDWETNAAGRCEVTMDPPPALEDLFHKAKVVLPSLLPQLLSKISVDQVIELRGAASKLFALGRKCPKNAHDEQFPRDYLEALVRYLEHISEFLIRQYPSEATRPSRIGVVVGRLAAQHPMLSKVVKSTGKPAKVLTFMVLRHLLTKYDILDDTSRLLVAGGGTALLNKLREKVSIMLLCEHVEEVRNLPAVVIPEKWRTSAGLLSTNAWK